MSEKHIGALDGLRALAALFVVFTHSASRHLFDGYNIGAIGVSIFFTLSGFLMGYLYLKKPFSRNSFITYSISRFSRIAPAYLTVILISYIVFNFVDNRFVFNIDNHNLLRHLLFSGNVSVFWSIPPEVQFYVFFVFIWYSLNALLVNGNYSFLIVLLLISIIAMFYRNQFPGTVLASKLHFFLFGCFVGALRQELKSFPIIKKIALLQFISLFFTLGLGLYLIISYGYKYPYEIIYYAPLTAVMIFILSYPTDFSNLLLANKPLTLIGKWSFSLYLTHEIVLQLVEYFYKQNMLGQFAAITIGLCGSLILSWIMFEVIESPTQAIIKNNLLDFFFKKSRISSAN